MGLPVFSPRRLTGVAVLKLPGIVTVNSPELPVCSHTRNTVPADAGDRPVILSPCFPHPYSLLDSFQVLRWPGNPTRCNTLAAPLRNKRGGRSPLLRWPANGLTQAVFLRATGKK
jgi:hypothetical protein